VSVIKLFNTASKSLEEFVPIKAGEAHIYSCGPTVYNFVHIGNLRAFVFSDVLRRVLMQNGYDVTHVMNITDVGHLTDDGDDGEDKMLVAMRREGKSAWDIAKFYTDSFYKHTDLLNILPKDHMPKATDYIAEQIELVKELEAKGFTYTTSDGVYFDTERYTDYGTMANLDLEGLRGGERIDLGEKKSKTDFALWKFSPADQKRDMEWESPWGKGFPGWHVECSAMSKALLGNHFDIHTGGIDHIPVHHTNEIAQSECANGEKYVNYWLHNEFLVLGEGAKISKSVGNFITLDTVIEQGIDPLAVRYFFLTAHYRKQLQFTWDALKDAQNALYRLWGKVARLDQAEGEGTAPEAMLEALRNDMNTPQALATLWQILDDKKAPLADKWAAIKAADAAFGISLLEDHSALIKPISLADLPADIQQKIEDRNIARAERNWAVADQLRDEFLAAGYQVQDQRDGMHLTRA
jgi:cysteinyl-tRNA synthetase